MKFCKKCAQMTFSKPKMEFVVVDYPMSRTTTPDRIVKAKFYNWDQAISFARTVSNVARVEEHEAGKTCVLCGGDK